MHLRTVLATSATVALVATGSLAGLPASGAGSRAERAATLSDFGYRADVYGVKLVTDNVEAFDVKDAHAQQRCTRAVGTTVQRQSAVTVPGNPLIRASVSASRTATYRDGATDGVRGVNTIADITLGGELAPGVRTPTITIRGLTSTADAFHTAKGFGHRESFTFDGITIDLLDNTVVQDLPPELQDVLAPLDQAQGQVFSSTSAAVDQVIQALRDGGLDGVEIPGLGTIGLGRTSGRTTGKSATSNVSALQILLTAGGRRQLLELGTARTRIGAPAPAGVFRAGGSAMDLQALQDNLHFGSVQHKALPCEGTLGKTVTYTVPSASQLFGVATNLTGVTYSHRGSQDARRDLAKGVTSTRVAGLSIPSLQLEIKDVVATARMRGFDGKRVESTVATSIGSITSGGRPIAVPAPGRTVDLPNGQGLIQRQLVDPSRYGKQVVALRITLFSEAVVIDLARTGGRIYPR